MAMKKFILPLLLATIPSGLPASQVVESQMKIYCAETKVVIEYLEKEHSEMPVIYGLGFTNQTDVMSLWLNPKTLTWTLLKTNGGKTCVVGTGTTFTVIDRSQKI